jgi:hypothetical protein
MFEATMNENQKTFIGPATYFFHRRSSLPRLLVKLNPLDRVRMPFFCSQRSIILIPRFMGSRRIPGSGCEVNS